VAAVNAVGDFVSSILVGSLWSVFNVQTAFAASALLFFAGAVLILRLRTPS
jgi:dipeptide/tripeptide permease